MATDVKSVSSLDELTLDDAITHMETVANEKFLEAYLILTLTRHARKTSHAKQDITHDEKLRRRVSRDLPSYAKDNGLGWQ